MGDHRAEAQPTSHVTAPPAPPVPARGGRRRADVPVDSQVAVEELVTAGSRPYVGRRMAAPVTEPTAWGSTPLRETVPAHRPFVDFGDDTMERVLGSLEPVDQTTSFEHEPTTRIPLIAANPVSTVPTGSDVLDDSAHDGAALLAPTPKAAGKRRAAKIGSRRPAILRSLPSAPVLLGLAALAVSVGGTLAGHDAAGSHRLAASITPASALSGTSSIGHGGSRGGLVTRDSDRQAQAQAAAGLPLAAAANGIAEQRNAALEKFAHKAESYSKVLASNQWITPVTPGVYHLTARFGQYGLWANFHTGLDFAAPTGTPIHAIASGTVIFVGWDGSYGNKTAVRLADGTEIWYAHQNQFATAVGDTVTQGQTIGYVGSTGNTTGPHVHIEVRPGGGDPVDPFPAFQQHGITP